MMNIKLWWKFEGRHFYRNICHGIKNLITWFPIIWKGRNWDHMYIYDILQKKLENQSRYIAERDFYVGAKHDASRTSLCVRLIEKIKTEYYLSEYMDYHKLEMSTVDCGRAGYSELIIKEVSNRFSDYFSKYPSSLRKVVSTAPISSSSQLARLVAVENHKKAKRILFSILDREIDKWWE